MYHVDIKQILAVFNNITDRILPIYESDDQSVQIKSDKSQVTEADLFSDELLFNFLKQTGYPIISEERNYKYKSVDTVWLVDPLDGTSDFIDGTNEFTILVSLINLGRPIFGAIFLPVSRVLYYAFKNEGAFKVECLKSETVHVSSVIDMRNASLLLSRHHLSGKDSEIGKKMEVKKIIKRGSIGLKVALIAEGAGDIYFSTSARISEWDTAACDILLSEAGGKMTDCNGNVLLYNKENSFQIDGIAATNGLLHQNVLKYINYGERKKY